MTRYGPWHSAATQAVSMANVGGFDSRLATEAAFDAARNDTPPGSGSGASRVESTQHGTSFFVGQDKLGLHLTGLAVTLNPFDGVDPMTMPVDSDGTVQYEGDTSWPAKLSWLSSVDATLAYADATTGSPFAVTPTGDTLDAYCVAGLTFAGTTPDQLTGWWTGADLSGWTRRASVGMGSTSTLTVSVLRGDISTPVDADDTRVWAVVLLVAGSQVSGAAPAAESGRRQELSTVSLSVVFQPPRYRWRLVGMPPLRQFPRDDYLGGTPRQGHASTSVQASPRQGYSNTYR